MSVRREPSRVVTYAPQLQAKPKEPRPKAEPVKPRKTGLLTKLDRAKRELTTWAENGFPVVSKEIRRARLQACKGCHLWSRFGNLGFGECLHPACGCTRAKLALATSRCPMNPPRWDRVEQ